MLSAMPPETGRNYFGRKERSCGDHSPREWPGLGVMGVTASCDRCGDNFEIFSQDQTRYAHGRPYARRVGGGACRAGGGPCEGAIGRTDTPSVSRHEAMAQSRAARNIGSGGAAMPAAGETPGFRRSRSSGTAASTMPPPPPPSKQPALRASAGESGRPTSGGIPFSRTRSAPVPYSSGVDAHGRYLPPHASRGGQSLRPSYGGGAVGGAGPGSLSSRSPTNASTRRMPSGGGIPLRRTISSPQDGGRGRYGGLGGGRAIYGNRDVGGLDLPSSGRMLLARSMSHDSASGTEEGGGMVPLSALLEASAEDVDMEEPTERPSARTAPPAPPVARAPSIHDDGAGAEPEPEMEDEEPEVPVTIKGKWKGKVFVRLSDSVASLLAKVSEASGLGTHEFCLLIGGKFSSLDMEGTLASHGIRKASKITAMKARKGKDGGGAGAARTATTTSGSAPQPCRRAGCDKFGSAPRNGYCSTCYVTYGGGGSGASSAASGGAGGTAAAAPVECKGGCGLYGQAERLYHCSVCFRKLPPELQATAPINKPTAPEPAAEDPDAPPADQPKGRCKKCRKKVGLRGIMCKCRYTFCGLHHEPPQHNCTYDERAATRARLARLNPEVRGDRVDMI